MNFPAGPRPKVGKNLIVNLRRSADLDARFVRSHSLIGQGLSYASISSRTASVRRQRSDHPRTPQRRSFSTASLPQTIPLKRYSSYEPESPAPPDSLPLESSTLAELVPRPRPQSSRSTPPPRSLLKRQWSSADEVWQTYRDFETRGRLVHLSEEKHFDLVCNYAQLASGEDLPSPERLEQLASRMGYMERHFMRKRRSHNTDTRLRFLRIASLALAGKVDDARLEFRALSALPQDGFTAPLVLLSLEQLTATYIRHQSLEDIFQLILDSWHYVAPYMTRPHTETLHRAGHSLHRRLQSIYNHLLPNPVAWYIEKKHRLSPLDTQRLATLILSTLCSPRNSHQALALYEEVKQSGLRLDPSLSFRIVQALAKDGLHKRAQTLYQSLAGPRSLQLSTGLFLASAQGDYGRARELYTELERRGLKTPSNARLLLHASALADQPNVTAQRFDEIFASTHPKFGHFIPVILAYARAGDVPGVRLWFDRVRKAGYQVDLLLYNYVLKAFVERGDFDAASALYLGMANAGIHGNEATFTQLITLFARRRDPVNAERMYHKALSRSITPTLQMVTSLLNAHAEASSWKGVVRVFDSMRGKFPLDIYVCNIVLKAYVLIGAPFSTVTSLFQLLPRLGVKPDLFSYTLIIQSACDAGRMGIAGDLYRQVCQLAEKTEYGRGIDAYILTVIMAGFLRVGDKARAKAVYEEMHKLQIEPTSVTHAVIIRAYANEGTVQSLVLVQDFLKSIGNSGMPWNVPPRIRDHPLIAIYGPPMSVYSRLLRPNDVEKLFAKLVELGADANDVALTLLMDGFRRVGDIDKVREVWQQLSQLVLHSLRQQDALADVHDTSYSQSSVLCLPFSIYIDALSSVGDHKGIADEWQRLQTLGFGFDAHNWNHLVVALVRAGEPERAFEIVERVILPQHDRVLYATSERDMHPTSPLLDQEGGGNDVVVDPRLSTMERRARAVRIAAQLASDTLDATQPDTDQEVDIVAGLDLLRQMTPSWNFWRPHAVTLECLAGVLDLLAEGRDVLPVLPVDVPAPAGSGGRGDPFKLYSAIVLKYPRTVKAAQDHRMSSYEPHRWRRKRVREGQS